MSRCNAITVTHNSERTITALLESLESQGEHLAQVIVVDNGSTDATTELVEEWRRGKSLPVTIVRSANRGFAGGHHTAALHVEDSSLPTLCVNPDLEMGLGVLEHLLQALASSERYAIATAPLVNALGEEDSASRRVLPSLGKSIAYSLLGRMLPPALRYNSRRDASGRSAVLSDGTPLTEVEATTGALMLVSQHFRPVQTGIFDSDYWMYGEDLQLCADAARHGLAVVMVESAPSTHLKGVSSGWPRSRRSNAAFHDALFIYYKKNLNRTRTGLVTVWLGIRARHAVSQGAGDLNRLLRRLRVPRATR